MRPTILTSLMLFASHGAIASRHFQRNIISDLVSAASTFLVGGGEDTATATSTTLKGAPATATQASSSKTKTSSNAQSSNPTGISVVSTTLTRSTISASTATSRTITSSATLATTASSPHVNSTISSITNTNSTTLPSTLSSSSSSSSSSSATPIPSNPANAAPSPSPVPSEQGGISPAGIAVAVVFSIFILGTIAWLVFRYHPRSRAWWAGRQEKKFQERSYRDAIDGPDAGAGTSRLRERALGENGRKSTYLASFFAPRTVKLGDGKEIRRKPVQWGARPGEEKVPLADMASPMGRSPRSPLSALEKPLPTPTIAQRTTKIYELP